ncbi:MAG: 50S ribosomal protein L28 [Chloroflexi bacterium]|jgi:large subunit ribosomal protein L28|nr:MAG: 50S ribosomal protein L28 [Chloroflexota bacterium]RLT47841.1 MAG: 50S ribosomal protein L28 [Chloroflexota bacterium]RLT54838.1 MAG: 50S ribosomal protein L28 [Chloroflexota bacterium]
MAKCVTCNKITGFGRNVPKSMHATRRTFKPNLQKTTILQNGRRLQVTMCTKCMKALAKT